MTMASRMAVSASTRRWTSSAPRVSPHSTSSASPAPAVHASCRCSPSATVAGPHHRFGLSLSGQKPFGGVVRLVKTVSFRGATGGSGFGLLLVRDEFKGFSNAEVEGFAQCGDESP